MLSRILTSLFFGLFLSERAQAQASQACVYDCSLLDCNPSGHCYYDCYNNCPSGVRSSLENGPSSNLNSINGPSSNLGEDPSLRTKRDADPAHVFVSLPTNTTSGRYRMKSNCEFYEAQAAQGIDTSARTANKTMSDAYRNVVGENFKGNNFTQTVRNVFFGPDANQLP